MPLNFLTVSEWNGPHYESKDITDPSWEDVSKAIRRLDNDHFNDVYLNRDDDLEHFWLCIGGGAGRYVITGVAEERLFPTVVSSRDRADEKVELIVGGQRGLYPISWIQDLHTALRAAKHFYDHGEFGGGLQWDNLLTR